MRPIILATDYGLSDPYVGQLKTKIFEIVPNTVAIDLIHNLPAFNPKASAYLLASFLEHIPKNSIVIGVVDPGVGSDRKEIVIEGDSYTFVGPNNGIFSIIARKLSQFSLSEIVVNDPPASKTFHGRDIFAPVAAQIAANQIPTLKTLSLDELVGSDWPDNLFEVIYIDHFGNAITGIHCNQINKQQELKIKQHKLKYAEKFSDVGEGESFWYCNSNNLVELSVREGSCCMILSINNADKVKLV